MMSWWTQRDVPGLQMWTIRWLWGDVASFQHAKVIHTDGRCGKRLYPPKEVASNLPAQACHWHAVMIKFYRSTPPDGTSVQTIK
jgi:hypothetical protein